MPEFLYPDGVSFTSESSVHIWASKIYHTIYGMDPDEVPARLAVLEQRVGQSALGLDQVRADWSTAVHGWLRS